MFYPFQNWNTLTLEEHVVLLHAVTARSSEFHLEDELLRAILSPDSLLYYCMQSDLVRRLPRCIAGGTPVL
jgi:hypothetical protein